MSIPDDFREQADALPPALRALLDGELAAGNQIAEAGHGFLGQPWATYLKLTSPFTTRARVWGDDGLQFNDFSDFGSTGAFTDHDRAFYILEPPCPPEPVPDMNAIRDAHAPHPSPHKTVAKDPNSALSRFEKSMVIDYVKWHDGDGYDMEALKAAKLEQPRPLRTCCSTVAFKTGATWRR
jgi:hypothetical protein